MYAKILMLRFPKAEVKKPIVSTLAKEYDVTFNILNATIFPRAEGSMVLELSAPTKKQFKAGVDFLKQYGVSVKNASQEVRRIDKRCTHCGFCTAVCPTEALYVQRPEMTVKFDQKKCSICELCIPTCPTRAMQISPKGQTFF